MDFRRLHTFRTVAALASFSKAATTLHCSQSTVSTQIKTLEEELDVTLFDRQGAGVALTKVGEIYLAYANRLLSIEEEARARVREKIDPPASLSLRMPQSVSERFLPEIIARFRPRHPLVGFDVSVCAFSDLHVELRTGVTDAAFLLVDDIPKSDLRTRRLAVAPLVFVDAPGRRGANGRRALRLRDLAEHSLLLPKHDCSYRMLLKQKLSERDIRPRSIVECNSMAMLKRCVAMGLGLALVPAFAVAEELARGELEAQPWGGKALEIGLLLIQHKNAWVSPELEDFLQVCDEVMGGDGERILA